MNQDVSKNLWIERIIWISLFLNPIFDVITSFSIHFMGKSMLFILGIKFLFLVYLMILHFRYAKKHRLWYLFLVGMYFVSFLILMVSDKGGSSLFLEAQNLFRTFYFPISFFFLYSLYESGVFQVKKKYLVWILFLYLLFLVVPELFHLGFSSYAYSKTGGLGWFYSTNEISGILAILGPFLILYLKDKKWIFKLLGMGFYLLGVLVIGTKVPVLAFCITIFLFFCSFVWKLIQNKEWKKICISALCAIVGVLGFGIVLLSSSFYENIKIHLDFLEIRQVSDLFTFHHIDHFIFSERLTFLSDTHAIYQSASSSKKVVGMGIVFFENEVPISMKMIEMDYFDIFYHYGVFGFVLFFVPLFFCSCNRKYRIDEVTSIVLVILLGFFSGHILVSPSVSVLVTCILLPKSDEEVLK